MEKFPPCISYILKLFLVLFRIKLELHVEQMLKYTYCLKFLESVCVGLVLHSEALPGI